MRARPARPETLVSLAVLGAAFAHALSYSWLRWGDLLTDCGRELELARQIAAGAVLYADVRWYYGPLAPYVNGALFRLFGVDVGVLTTAGFLSAVAMCVLLLRLGRRVAGPLPAVLAALAFVYLCAFGHYYWNGIFNWVLPYTYAATYGMLAATASLYWLVRHVEEGRGLHLGLSLACLALAALAKVEAFVPAAAAHVVFVVTERPRLLPYAAAALATLGVFGIFWLQLGSSLVRDYVALVLGPATRPSILLHMGLADLPPTLAAIGRSALALGVVLATVAIAGRLERGPSSSWPVAALCAVVAALVYGRLSLFDQLRIVPAVLLVLVVHLAVARRRAGAEDRSTRARLLLATFALACVMRMPLSTGAFHYGFYLLPVPLLVFLVWWFHDVPAWIPGRPARPVAWAGVGLVAALIFVHYQASRAMYAKHTTFVDAPRGHMYLMDETGGFPTGPSWAEAVRLLARQPRGTRVLIVPEGIGIAFLAGLEGVCGMHSFLPPELAPPVEQRLLDCLRAAPPEFIVRILVNLDEYGVYAFGEGYATDTTRWIVTHYVPIAQFGPSGYVLVLRRR